MGSSETVGEVQACINRVYLGGEQSRAREEKKRGGERRAGGGGEERSRAVEWGSRCCVIYCPQGEWIT